MTTNARDVSVTDASIPLWTLKYTGLLSTYGSTNWTMLSSGTGGSGGVYSQAGDVITSASVLLRPNSWWTWRGHGLRDGSTTYYQQHAWQTDGAGLVRWKVSLRAGFGGGSPSPTQVPSAVDEVVLLGGGTDAAPTYEALFPASASWMQAQFSESSDFAWLLTYPVGGGPASAILVFGLVRPLYDTTGGLVDKSPHFWYAAHGSACALSDGIGSEVAGPLGFLDAAGTAQFFGRLPASFRMVNTSGSPAQALPGHLPQNPSYTAAPLYAQDTLRLCRRQEVAGTSTGTHETGNLNTCGDKGEAQGLRYSGRLFTVPTLLSAVDPGTGLPEGESLLALGHLLFPWQPGVTVQGGA